MENIPRLQPLSIGELLDKAISLYRRKFLLSTVFSGILLLPVTIVQLFAYRVGSGSEYQTIMSFITLVSSWIFGSLLAVVLVSLFSSAYMNSPIHHSEIFKTAISRFWSALWTNLFQAFAIVGPIICIGGVLGPILRLGHVIVYVFLYLPYVIFLLTHWILILPIIVIEKLWTIDSMKRSWRMIHPSFWRILGVSIASVLLTWFVSGLPLLFLRYGATLIPEIGPLIPFLSSGFNFLGNTIAVPLRLSICVIVYYDLRVRMEGFGLELMTVSSS